MDQKTRAKEKTKVVGGWVLETRRINLNFDGNRAPKGKTVG